MLKSMSIYQRDNKGIVKSNFITLCLAFRGSIPTNSYQPQSSRLDTAEKNLLYNYITFLYHPTTRYHLFSICSLLQWYFSSLDSICSLLQWYFSSLDYATIPYNSILDNIANGNTHKPKGFLCCYISNKNHLECTHSQRQTCESPHQTESPISWYKDSHTYNPLFSKDTRPYV